MGLGDLAVPVVYPLLKEKLRSWDPLKVCVLGFLNTVIIFLAYLLLLKPLFSYFKDPSYCLEDIGQWRAILESRDLHSSGPDSNMDPYHRSHQLTHLHEAGIVYLG